MNMRSIYKSFYYIFLHSVHIFLKHSVFYMFRKFEITSLSELSSVDGSNGYTVKGHLQTYVRVQ